MTTASDRDRAPIDHGDGFVIEAEFDPPRMTLALKGELDLAGAPTLERQLDLVAWPQIAELVFDLAEVTFIDSTGLSALIRSSQRAATEGVRHSVVRVPDQPQKLFTIAGVTGELHVQP